jgi:hypothetical protein
MKKDVPLKIQGTQKISNKKRITPKSIKDSKDPDEKIGIPQKRLKRPPIKKYTKKCKELTFAQNNQGFVSKENEKMTKCPYSKIQGLTFA